MKSATSRISRFRKSPTKPKGRVEFPASYRLAEHVFQDAPALALLTTTTSSSTMTTNLVRGRAVLPLELPNGTALLNSRMLLMRMSCKCAKRVSRRKRRHLDLPQSRQPLAEVAAAIHFSLQQNNAFRITRTIRRRRKILMSFWVTSEMCESAPTQGSLNLTPCTERWCSTWATWLRSSNPLYSEEGLGHFYTI